MKHLAGYILSILLLWNYGGGVLPDNYRLYVGTTSGNYDVMTVDTGPNTWAELTLDPGTYFFAVSALKDSNESAKSVEIQAEVKGLGVPQIIYVGTEKKN